MRFWARGTKKHLGGDDFVWELQNWADRPAKKGKDFPAKWAKMWDIGEWREEDERIEPDIPGVHHTAGPERLIHAGPTTAGPERHHTCAHCSMSSQPTMHALLRGEICNPLPFTLHFCLFVYSLSLFPSPPIHIYIFYISYSLSQYMYPPSPSFTIYIYIFSVSTSVLSLSRPSATITDCLFVLVL